MKTFFQVLLSVLTVMLVFLAQSYLIMAGIHFGIVTTYLSFAIILVFDVVAIILLLGKVGY